MAFIELSLRATELHAAGMDGRDELEDPLQEALVQAGLGEITGGGGGLGMATIDIEVSGALDVATTLIRDTLQQLGVQRYEIRTVQEAA